MQNLSSILIVVGALSTFWLGAGTALALGIALALTLGNPFLSRTRQLTRPLLAWGIVGLGAGADLHLVARAGSTGLIITALGILATIGLGFAMQKWLRADRETSLLLSVGTAICGGSAIAAVAPAIRAKESAISIALATVFILNASALFLFPEIGRIAGLSQEAFGLWSALAIHDTSSVVGATMSYGTRALEVGTAVKLARAAWIAPVALVFAWLYARRGQEAGRRPVVLPWFIIGFVLASALVTFVPVLRPAGEFLELIARRILVLTLFLIGAGLTRATVKSVGPRPMILGVLLWLIVSASSFAAVWSGWISI